MIRTRAILFLLAALTALVVGCGPQASPSVVPANTGVPSAGPSNAPPLTEPRSSSLTQPGSSPVY